MSAEQAWVDAVERLGPLAPPLTRQLQAVVDMTARMCGVPIAQVNFFTHDEQRQVAAHGMDVSVCALGDSLCHAVREEAETIVVPDARADPRLRDNPFVTGRLGRVRFYASHPLVTSTGLVVGRLCVFDEEPRDPHGLDQAGTCSLEVVAASVMDVLELALRNRQLEEALEHVSRMRTELRESQERLAVFAGQISHDLKTPLSSVSFSLELVRDQLASAEPDLDEVRWLVDKADAGAARMGVLVDDVLAYALVGGTEQHGDVDLGQVLAEVLEDLSGELDGATVAVGELPTVTGDRTQLRSLLQNLVGNAARYRAPDRPLHLDVQASRRATWWVLEVSDNGRGIAPHDAERVFDPLVRADRSTEGTGIGLATCRRIVGAHGGRIGLHPRTGHGTTARVELPVSGAS